MSVEIVTFGCRLNAFESEVILREAENAGLSDTIVINSCAVTNEAVAQARQSIRRLKRARPEARIVVTGCAAQVEPQMDSLLHGLAHAAPAQWNAEGRGIADDPIQADEHKRADKDSLF